MAYVNEMEATETLPIEELIIDKFKSIVGEDHVIEDAERRTDYGHDKTEDYQFMPDVVLRPANPNEVSELLKICNQYKLPTTPRGAGTGLSGGALPIK